VPTSPPFVTSSLTSRDYDVIIVTSQSSKSSHSETRIRINYPYGSFKHMLSQNIALNISSFGLELWEKKHLAVGATALRQKFGTFLT